MKKIRNWNDYNYYVKKINRLDVDLENFLISNVNNQHREKALDELIKYNISTCHYYARKYNWCNISYEDLVQYGVGGIISAADNFDPTKEVRFSTFATYYIIGRLKRALEQHNNLIRLPAHINLALIKLSNYLPYEEIPEEELNNLATDKRKLSHLKQAVEIKKQKVINIDEIIDITIDENFSFVHKDVLISQLLSVLTENEKKAVILKFGLFGQLTHTLLEITRIIGLDAENLLIIAFKKLKKKTDERLILDILRDE